MIMCLNFKITFVIQVIWRSTVKRMQNSVRRLHSLVRTEHNQVDILPTRSW